MTIRLKQILLPENPAAPKYDFYFVCDGDDSPIADFFDMVPQDARDVFYDRFRVIADRGKDRMRPQSFRRLHGPYKELYEFKNSLGYRLACFFDGKKCIIAEGWKKTSNEASNRDNRHYERANNRRLAWLEENKEKGEK